MRCIGSLALLLAAGLAAPGCMMPSNWGTRSHHGGGGVADGGTEAGVDPDGADGGEAGLDGDGGAPPEHDAWLPDPPELDGGPGDGGDDPGPPDDDPPDDDPPDDDPDPPSGDTCYSEPAFPDADISGLVAAYGGSGWQDELIEAVRRRWPAGADLLEAQRDDSYFFEFSDPSSWPGMVDWLATLVHEETHLFDAYHAMEVGESFSLFFRGDLILYPPDLDSFPRSEIRGMVEAGDGMYADTYLTGWQGERGFTELLDELTAYVNEMAALGLLGDYYEGYGTSSRDGAVAFLYFLELYLRRARTAHPDFYDAARADPVVHDIVEYQWLRTHFFLEFSDRFSSLGINDDAYRAAMHAPDAMREISDFLGHTVSDSSCLVE